MNDKVELVTFGPGNETTFSSLDYGGSVRSQICYSGENNQTTESDGKVSYLHKVQYLWGFNEMIDIEGERRDTNSVVVIR